MQNALATSDNSIEVIAIICKHNFNNVANILSELRDDNIVYIVVKQSYVY